MKKAIFLSFLLRILLRINPARWISLERAGTQLLEPLIALPCKILLLDSLSAISLLGAYIDGSYLSEGCALELCVGMRVHLEKFLKFALVKFDHVVSMVALGSHIARL